MFRTPSKVGSELFRVRHLGKVPARVCTGSRAESSTYTVAANNRLQISLVCFGVNDAREAIGGDVQLARRFEQFTLSRWAANEQFEILVALILRNTPLRQPSVLTAKSLRRILQITEGITANIFHIINSLAIEAIESGKERITDEAIEKWEPEFDAEAAFA